ncbi:MAG: LPS export ABC transporter ATP-binding protein [Gammaproteobacteria bacterium]|nr:MAG: LPS export ABC transporter ATP-binding protein [Gammaproteobacteria bacterium]
MSVLAGTGLAKSYKGNRVVDEVSLHVQSGEVVGLLGPNGAGKTTSFYMLVGLIRADEGSVCLDHENISAKPLHVRARMGVGYLPQEPSVFRRLTVEENILAVLQTRKNISAEEAARRVDELLDEFGLGHKRDALGISLSGGERRRVEIARALALNPSFILLDEPFAGIDPISVMDIQTIISHLKSSGIGVLITDHNVRETLGITDRAYIVNQGRIIADGTPAEILENREVREVYLGKNFRL